MMLNCEAKLLVTCDLSRADPKSALARILSLIRERERILCGGLSHLKVRSWVSNARSNQHEWIVLKYKNLKLRREEETVRRELTISP